MIQEELSTTVSVARKVSDGNYGSYEVFESLNGVTIDTTEEEMDAILDQGKIAFKKLQSKIKEKIERGF